MRVIRKRGRRQHTSYPARSEYRPAKLDKHLSEIPPNRAVITYCTCPHEASAAQVGQELLDRGFKNVHALYGGFDAWRDAGYPVESKETRSSKGAGES